MVRKNKLMSWIFTGNHFTQPDEDGYIQCQYCKRSDPNNGIYKYMSAGGTSSTKGAITHLKNAHPELLEQAKQGPIAEINDELMWLATVGHVSIDAMDSSFFRKRIAPSLKISLPPNVKAISSAMVHFSMQYKASKITDKLSYSSLMLSTHHFNSKSPQSIILCRSNNEVYFQESIELTDDTDFKDVLASLRKEFPLNTVITPFITHDGSLRRVKSTDFIFHDCYVTSVLKAFFSFKGSLVNCNKHSIKELVDMMNNEPSFQQENDLYLKILNIVDDFDEDNLTLLDEISSYMYLLDNFTETCPLFIDTLNNALENNIGHCFLFALLNPGFFLKNEAIRDKYWQLKKVLSTDRLSNVLDSLNIFLNLNLDVDFFVKLSQLKGPYSDESTGDKTPEELWGASANYSSINSLYYILRTVSPSIAPCECAFSTSEAYLDKQSGEIPTTLVEALMRCGTYYFNFENTDSTS